MNLIPFRAIIRRRRRPECGDEEERGMCDKWISTPTQIRTSSRNSRQVLGSNKRIFVVALPGIGIVVPLPLPLPLVGVIMKTMRFN